jgi:hypothetical protein
MTSVLSTVGSAGLVVECRAGGLARAAGKREVLTSSGELDMTAWKALVDAAAAYPDRPLVALFFGEANLIAGYRLYYMLRYASRAGLRDVTLVTDGRFWIEEASDWLVECGVSRIGLVEGDTAESVDARVMDLRAARERAGVSAPEIFRLRPGTLNGARVVDWRGRECA